MNYLTDWVEKVVDTNPYIKGKILTSILLIIVIFLVYKLVSKLAIKHIKDMQIQYRLKKISGYSAGFLGILLVGIIWFEGSKSISTFLGLFSAGVAIALKDPVVNIAAWAFIILRRPFEVGDRIEIGNSAGDVIDLRLFQFTLLEIGNWVDGDQSTGRIIHIPNGKVFNENLANYSKGFQYIWNEIPVCITFESNWKRAKGILQKIANKHAGHLGKEAEQKVREASRKFMIFYNRLTPTVYTTVKDSCILLTIRYLCEPRHRRGSSQSMWEDILQEFEKCEDIDFAYPTQRFYNNAVEGKVKTKQPSYSNNPSAPLG